MPHFAARLFPHPPSTRREGSASPLKKLCSLLLCALLSFECAVPAPAQAFFFGGVTLKDEKEMGRKVDVLVRANLPMVEDPEVSGYVKDLVARITRAIPPQPFQFTTGVILHNAINAFAVPGGHVYCFTGLLMDFTSEAQVAGVLCHELAHVTQRHVAARLERAQVVTLASLLLAVAGVIAGAGGGAAAASVAAGQSAMLGYSRADETEADQIGLQYLIKAGFAPQGMVGGFKILRQKSYMRGTSIPPYLSTHPDISQRVNGIQARIDTMPASIRNRAVDETRFKRMQLILWGRYGDTQTALQRFKGPDALSLTGRGMVLSRMNNVREAARCFDEAVRLAPDDGIVLREAGIFQYRKGDATRAGDLLRKALARDRGDFMARYFLARLMDDSGNAAGAQAEFKDVLRILPEESEVHESLGKSYGRSGRQDLAYIHLAYSAIYAHRKDLAEKYFDKARALSGSAGRDFSNLEKTYKERKEIWKKM